MYVDQTSSVAISAEKKRIGRVIPSPTKDICIALLQAHSTADNNLLEKAYADAYDYLRADKTEYKIKRRQLSYTQLSAIASACDTSTLAILQDATGFESNCLSETETQFLAQLASVPDAKLQALYDAICIRSGCPWIPYSDGKEEVSPSTRLKMGVIVKATYGVLGEYKSLYNVGSRSELSETEESDPIGQVILQFERSTALPDAEIFKYAQKYHVPLKWVYSTPKSGSFWGYKPWAENLLCIMMLCHPHFSQFAADCLNLTNPMSQKEV